MEIIFQRNKALDCLKTIKKYNKFYISTLSIHICIDYLEKDLPKLVKNFIEIIDDMSVLDLDSQTIFKTFDEYNEKNFEDWLQINIAFLNKIPNFLTLDRDLYKNHKDKLNIILL